LVCTLNGEKNVAIKYTLKVKPDGAHDGFVAVDPEGYLLEFEMFSGIAIQRMSDLFPQLKACRAGN